VDRITLPTADGPREYLLFAPRRAGGVNPPLVVFLHGTGGTAEWADDEAGWSALAAKEGFALALPEGLPPDPARPPKFLTNPRRWNSGELRSAEFGMRNEDAASRSSIPHSEFRTPQSCDDVGFLGAVIDDAITRAGADPSRVYLSGFSNGAGMAFRAAAGLADRVAAVAPVAGYCRVPEGERPSRPVPTLYVIGSADPLVPPRGGEVRNPWEHRLVRRRPVAEGLDRWAGLIGCRTPPEVVAEADGVREEVYPGPVPFRVVTIDGLGHHWPGGKGRLNHRLAGPPSDRWDATARVWEWFEGAGERPA
jgi:polyhydroxybutyrate depolymerase